MCFLAHQRRQHPSRRARFGEPIQLWSSQQSPVAWACFWPISCARSRTLTAGAGCARLRWELPPRWVKAYRLLLHPFQNSSSLPRKRGPPLAVDPSSGFGVSHCAESITADSNGRTNSVSTSGNSSRKRRRKRSAKKKKKIRVVQHAIHRREGNRKDRILAQPTQMFDSLNYNKFV